MDSMKFLLMVIIVSVFLGIAAAIIVNAESAIVSFDSIAHTHSITGQCDTTTVIDTAIVRTIHDPYRQFPPLVIVRIDTLGIYHLHATRLAYNVYYEVVRSTITCEAIITWEVKR